MSVQIVAFVNQNAQLMLQFQTQKAKNEKWLELNKKYSEVWPNITEKKDPPKDSEKFKDEKNKFEKYFKENIQ